MTVSQVAARLVALCTRNEFVQAQEELYADNILRIETDGATTQGKEKTLAFEKKFLSMLTAVHCTMTEPQVASDYFTTVMQVDITFTNGQQSQSSEVCVYKVESGKIVFEQFFRSPQPVRPAL